MGRVGPGRGSAVSDGPFPRPAPPNPACDLPRTGLSTGDPAVIRPTGSLAASPRSRSHRRTSGDAPEPSSRSRSTGWRSWSPESDSGAPPSSPGCTGRSLSSRRSRQRVPPLQPPPPSPLVLLSEPPGDPPPHVVPQVGQRPFRGGEPEVYFSSPDNDRDLPYFSGRRPS